MHEEQNGQPEITSSRDAVSPDINALFEQLNPQDVEQFYQSYQLWSTQHHITQLNVQIAELHQQRSRNAEAMQSVQPSSIALSVLAQLQAHGVEDIDLLDRMLERGEEWLDHAMGLLTRCEELDMIQGDYTLWCDHALEGAYDWIGSMTEAQVQPEEPVTADETSIEQAEALLLHKLMSDEDVAPELADAATTPSLEDEAVYEHNLTAPDEEEEQPEIDAVIEFALDERPATEDAEPSTTSRKITGPLQPKTTGSLQPEEDAASQAQDESEAAVADDIEAIATAEDGVVASPQDEPETIAGDELEAITATENEAITHIQDEPQIIIATEDEATTQTQDEPQITIATEDEATAHIQDEDEVTTATEDEAVAQIQSEPETVSVPEDNPSSQMQPENVEALQQPEEAEAAPLLEDEAPTQAPEETVVKEPISADVSTEQPTATLSITHRKLKVAPVDSNVEDQPQEEITQPLDEYIMLEAQHEEKSTHVNADEHALPPIDKQQSPELVNDQPQQSELVNNQEPSPEPINDQPPQPEPVLTTPAATPHKATTTMTPAPATKKKRRGWFSWLFRGRRRN
ncbi:MAG TPA: hypothetical protein VH593_12035 [Ktedonobacteraceae bacterium]